jgi:tripartite-type tricarboxylate transporter receptor subunit TctC
MFRWTILCLALIWTLMLGFKTGHAASADDNFYKGKTIRLIVAFSAGGGYDTYSQTCAASQ